MTRGEIRNKVRKQLGETTAAFWTDSEFNLWINEGISEIAWRTRCLRKNAYMTPVVSTLEYVLSDHFSDVFEMLEVYHKQEGSSWRKLEKTNRKALDVDQEGWLSADDGTPNQYAYDLEEDWLAIYPPPTSTNVGTNYVRAYYVYKPTDLTTDGAIPEIPARLHEMVVEHVKITAYETRGLGDRANNSRQIYINGIKDYSVLSREQHDEEIIMRPIR